ncbi:MAG TPA: hypothetical protein VI078_08230, partial [bacterium]
QEYAGMFHYQGSRTYKHVREHEVYAIGYPGDFTSTQRSLAKQSRQAGATGFDALMFRVENYWDSFAGTMARWERRAIMYYNNATRRQRVAVIGTASIVLLSLLVTLTVKLASRPSPVLLAAQGKADSARTPSGVAAQAAMDNKVQLHLDTKVQTPPESSTAKKAAERKKSDKTVQGVKKSSRVRTLAETTGAPAVVSLLIKPWGEVYLDGRMQGVSPPLLELQVVGGSHEIKIRNTTFPTRTVVIKVAPGEKIKIEHKFAN